MWSPELPTESQAALVARVAEEIQSRVVSGELQLGSWLRQDRLAAQYDVSRTPIREALQTLSARGIVELIPNRGARVRLPTLREIREAYFVRAELEGLAAELAADLATQQQLDRLRAAEALFEDAVPSAHANSGGAPDAAAREHWHAANDEFHEVVLEASCNRMLRTLVVDLHRRFPRNLTWGVLDDVRLLQDNVGQHRRMREAIERRDGAEARRLMRAHVRRSGELIVARAPAGGSGVAEPQPGD
jgi:DNA-binding GntR family transcriptional regulator